MGTWLKDRRLHLLWAAACLGVLVAPATNAMIFANAAEQKAPDEVDAGTKKLMAAQGLYQRGLFKLAAQEYADFLNENPRHAQRTAATYALGLCQYRQNDFERAAKLMNSVLADQTFAQRAETLAVLAQCELAQKHYEKSLAALDELLAKHGESALADSAAINRVQALYSLGKYADAAEGAQRYLEKYAKGGQRAAALYCAALSQRALNKNEEALASAQALLKDYGDSRYATDGALVAGQALEGMGKTDAAIEQYKRMLTHAPAERKSDAQFSLGVALYKAGKYGEAIATLANVGEGPYAKPARLQLGLAQLAANKIAEARKTLTPLVEDGDVARANAAKYGLARCDIADKSYESARGILVKLLQASPAPANAGQIALDCANCSMEMGQFEQAAGEFAVIAKKYANSAQGGEALYRQAYCLHRLKKFEASHAICEGIARGDGAEFKGPAMELDGENLFLMGKYAEAGKVYQGLIQNEEQAGTPSPQNQAGGTPAPQKLLRFKLRLGQCAYFAGDYGNAAEILAALAQDRRTASAVELQPAIFLMGDALLQQNKYKEAAEALGKFIQVSKGDTSEAQFKLGLAYLKDNDEQGALKVFEKLARLDEQSAWVQRGLVEYGQLLRKVGKGSQAAAVLKRVVDEKAAAELAAPATYLLGWCEFDAKHFAQAAELWKQMGENYPTHALAADALFRRGVALKEAGEMEQAAAALQAFAKKNPDSPDALKAKQMAAACLSAGGKPEEAGAVLASLARDPKANDSVLYDLAWSQRGAKNISGAVESYRRLLKEHADSKLAAAVKTELAELLYEDKKYDQAVELLEAVVADGSADPKLLSNANYRLGWCYQKLSRPEKAAAAFAKFDPAKAGAGEEVAASALLQAGLAYAEQQKFDLAEKSLAEMVKQYPKNSQASVAYLRLGEVQAELGKYDASAATYAAFISKFPKDPFVSRAHFGIGWSLENRKQYEQARAEYKKVIAESNGETAARAQFQIGESYLGEGKFDLALPALLAVEDVYAYPKWSARALFESGRVFEELKQADQARKQYEMVSTKYKDAPEATLARERLKAMGK